MSWIERIRQKPRTVKVKIMWFVGIAVALLLIATWVLASKISQKRSSAAELFQSTHNKFNDDQNYYQKTLEDRGGKIPDSIKKLH